MTSSLCEDSQKPPLSPVFDRASAHVACLGPSFNLLIVLEVSACQRDTWQSDWEHQRDRQTDGERQGERERHSGLSLICGKEKQIEG